MMRSLALMMLVYVVGYYCAPDRITTGGKLDFEAATNLTAGVNAVIGKDNGAYFIDGELVGAANVTGKVKAAAYAGLNDHIVSTLGEASGAAGVEAKPGIHLKAGIDNNGNIPLEFQPRLPAKIHGTGGYNVELGSGADANRVAGGMGAFIKERTPGGYM